MDLLTVQGTLKRLFQHHSSKALILWRSAFFIVQLSHPYMTTGKTIALTRWTFVGMTTWKTSNSKVFYVFFLNRFGTIENHIFGWQFLTAFRIDFLVIQLCSQFLWRDYFKTAIFNLVYRSYWREKRPLWETVLGKNGKKRDGLFYNFNNDKICTEPCLLRTFKRMEPNS